MTANGNSTLHAWVRQSRRHGAAAQRKLAQQHGAATIWVEGENEVTMEHFAKSRRRGDVVGVSTFGRLGRTRSEWRANVKDLIGRGCTIKELSTGRTITTPRDVEIAVIVMDVADELSGDVRALTKRAAQKAQSASAKQRRKNTVLERLPVAEARQIWHNNSDWTNADCLAQMPGWSEPMAYRDLKKRKLAKGRPRKE